MEQRSSQSNSITAISIILISLMAALIANPARYIHSVYGGILLFATNVLPALFPFFFFSKALTAIGCVGTISQYCKRPMRYLYNAPPSSAYVLLMSLIGGYPIGANLVGNLYELGEIDTAQAKSIMAFTSTSGPIFIIGTVASGMFNSTKMGVILLISHYIGAILNGFIYRQRTKSPDSNDYTPPIHSIDNALGEVATSSVQSILNVGAYIAIFSMIIDVLLDTKVITTIAKLLSYIGCPTALTQSTLIGIIEITRGSLLLSQSGLPIMILLPITCGIVSFGGMAVTLQSLSFLGKCNIKASQYLLCKTTQCLLSMAICALLTWAFLPLI